MIKMSIIIFYVLLKSFEFQICLMGFADNQDSPDVRDLSQHFCLQFMVFNKIECLNIEEIKGQKNLKLNFQNSELSRQDFSLVKFQLTKKFLLEVSVIFYLTFGQFYVNEFVQVFLMLNAGDDQFFIP